MIAVILLAGGQSSRMGSEIPDKVLARVMNRSVFAWSAEAFATSGITEITVCVHRDDAQRENLLQETSSCQDLRKVIWTQGGKERRDSVRNALQALPERTKAVFIHDCARPLIRPKTLRSLSEALSEHPAVTLARRMTDTLKIAETTANEGVFATKSLDRQGLWVMETPQVFEFDLILRAHDHALEENLAITDDVSAVEALGHPVQLIEAGYPNPKITTCDDLLLVESLLASRKDIS